MPLLSSQPCPAFVCPPGCCTDMHVSAYARPSAFYQIAFPGLKRLAAWRQIRDTGVAKGCRLALSGGFTGVESVVMVLALSMLGAPGV